MSRPYRHILKEVRLAFPQPVSDPINDSYFVHSITAQLIENIFRYVHSEAMGGRGAVVSSNECYRRTRHQEPVFAQKSYIQSPSVDESDIEVMVAKVLEAREKVA